MEIKTTIIDDLSINYAQSVKNSAETLLLLSPLPENLLAFVPIWEGLVSKYNIVAVDLPNFGKSQSRSSLLSPKAMSAFIFKIMDHFNIDAAHIVGPDIGTTVGFFAAEAHPERVRSVIGGSAACVFPIQSAGILTDMIMDPTLDGLKKYASADIISGALDNISVFQLPKERKQDYIDSYADGRFWDTMLFLKALPKELPSMDYTKLDTPVLILWGKNDPLAIVENGIILNQQLPKSKLYILETGHYVWEDEHENYLNHLIKWIDGEYLDV